MSDLDLDLEELRKDFLKLESERNKLARIMISEHFAYKEVTARKDAEIASLRKATQLMITELKKVSKDPKKCGDAATLKTILETISELEKADKESENIALSRESAASTSRAEEQESHLISSVTIFLMFLPFGASVERICSFINENCDINMEVKEVEDFLKRYKCFGQKTAFIPSLSKSWSVCA